MIHRAERVGVGLVLSVLTGCGLLDDGDDPGWGRQRAGEFQDCRCQYTVTGSLERSEDGVLNIYELDRGGDRKPYYGGDGSLLFECASGPDPEDDARGVSLVIDDFHGPDTYRLGADPDLDPSTFRYRPSNLGNARFEPRPSSVCEVEIFPARAGRFVCRDLDGPDDATASVEGSFECDRSGSLW